MHTVQAATTAIAGTMSPAYERILTEDARDFLAALSLNFDPPRRALLEHRRLRQREMDAGILPEFLPETAHIRDSEWMVAPLRPDLADRSVEITGPVERETMCHALYCGANVFLADFEDAHAPSWHNTMQGQMDLCDAVDGRLGFSGRRGGQHAADTATLMVRPRGWHREEKNFLVCGKPIPAALFDFGAFFFHNARKLAARDSGSYFSLPKIESHLEARLWNEVFLYAHDYLSIPAESIRATVAIETLPAAFEMDEILYELRHYSAGLSFGRRGYLASVIRSFRNHHGFVLPDEVHLTPDRHFLAACSQLLVQTCHRRGVHAIGTLETGIPLPRELAAGERMLERVRKDKMWELHLGYDGTQVAHPDMVPCAREVFRHAMRSPHQIALRSRAIVTAGDLLQAPAGPATERCFHRNIEMAIRFLESWLRGRGRICIDHQMEDLATADLRAAQVGQWLARGRVLDCGCRVTADLVDGAIASTVEHLRREIPGEFLDQAAAVFRQVATRPQLSECLAEAACAWLPPAPAEAWP